MSVIVFMNNEHGSLVDTIVDFKRKIEREIARGRRRGESQAELTMFVKQIDMTLAAICRHIIVEDDIELTKGFEPQLKKITFCEICGLSASECGSYCPN